MNGFLGTGATWRADLNLVVQVVMALALLAGMGLARRGRFDAHGYCQSSVMLLNLLMIALVMSPAFHRQVQPNLTTGLGDAYYAVAAVHASLGTLAELLGLYVVLVAGTNVVPKRLRFTRYKPWMCTVLVLWWLVVFFGIGTYSVWYLAPSPKAAVQASGPARSGGAASDGVSVTVKNYEFRPRSITVAVGTTVEWVTDAGRHTIERDAASFKSAPLSAGDRFEVRFERPGTFPYFCEFHGDRGGREMAGVVTVTPETIRTRESARIRR